MLKETVASDTQREVVLMDSISYVDESDEGKVVLTGSHGGMSSGEYAIRIRLAGVIFNDAGVGREEAGIAALQLLQGIDVPAAAVSHMSGKIGQARDMWENGVISHFNPAAESLGVRAGLHVQEAANLLQPEVGT